MYNVLNIMSCIHNVLNIVSCIHNVLNNFMNVHFSALDKSLSTGTNGEFLAKNTLQLINDSCIKKASLYKS